MGISSDMGVIALVLAGVFAYVAFLLWTPKKVLSEKPNRFFSFLIGFALAFLLYYVHLIGVTIGGFCGGVLIVLFSMNDAFSYVLSGCLGLLMSAYAIKVLPSKINNDSFRFFRIISIVIYFLFGLYMITLHSSSALSMSANRSLASLVLGFSSIGVALCAAVIPNLQKKSVAKSAPVSVAFPESASSSADTQAEIDSPLESAASDAIVPESDYSVPAMPSAPESPASAHVSVHFSINKRVLIILAVLVALFVGLGVGVLLGEGYFAPQFTPASPYIESATDTAYSNGYRNGFSSGQISGYNSGSESGQSDGYTNGYSDGYDEGYSSGYNDGFDDGYYGY